MSISVTSPAAAGTPDVWKPSGAWILLLWLSLGCLACEQMSSGSSGQPGFILYSPLLSTTTYLIDKQGQVVHTWQSDTPPGASVYLLDTGHLLRCGRQPDLPDFSAGGEGGRIQELTWEGELVWDFVYASSERRQHHDIEPLPSGNVLLIAWERKSTEEALQAGRRPELLSEAGLWPDSIVEVRPRRPEGGEIVWEWHLWDHLIQDYDPERDNFGSVAAHPELVDINGTRPPQPDSPTLLERLKALGYLAAGATARDRQADFTHTNSIAYNPRLDQIALSVPTFNEIWILDHGTTTEEAAGHVGGRAGRGGDLLYRWGNPRTYRRGTPEDQRLFGQHDARWVPVGYPGAGNLMVLDNGAGRPRGRFSRVLEIVPPVDRQGRYALDAGGRFGPQEAAWTYTAPDRESFFAEFISGAHRLPNGNTLISSGPKGRLFEVTAKGETVWTFDNPFSGDAPNPHGDPPFSLFRATLVAPEHRALAGRDLRPLDPQPPRQRQ